MAGLTRTVTRLEGLPYDTKRVQDNIARVLDLVLKIPILDGVHVQSVEIEPTGTRVQHRLGRLPIGWFITSQNANAVIWQTNIGDLYLELQSSAQVEVDLWVF